MLEEIVTKLQQLDLWSMGIGIILVVVTFFVWRVVRSRKTKVVK